MPAELGRNFSFGEEADFFKTKFTVLSCCLCYYILCIMASSDHAISIGRHIFATIAFKIFPTGVSTYRIYAFTWHSIARTGANSIFFLDGEGGEMVIGLLLCMTCDICYLLLGVNEGFGRKSWCPLIS